MLSENVLIAVPLTNLYDAYDYGGKGFRKAADAENGEQA